MISMFLAAGFAAELPTPDLSPRAEVEQMVGVTEVSVEYSSPGKKDRTVWGELVPWGELWRTGANSATLLETDNDLMVGGQAVPAGTYALFTIPGEDEWTVILNTNINQGGTGQYDEKLDTARFTVKPMEGGPRERLTFLFSDTTSDGTNLDLEWDGVLVRIPITVDTNALVKASVGDYQRSAAGDLRNAARHMQRIGEHDEALRLIDSAIALDDTWFSTWIRASVLHDKGEHKEAKKAAKKALEQGEKAENFFYEAQVRKAVDEWPKK